MFVQKQEGAACLWGSPKVQKEVANGETRTRNIQINFYVKV